MAAILDSGSYPAIRAAIDVTLDTLVLPDATIEMPIFKDAADLAVKRLVPTWQAIVTAGASDALTHLKNAAIYTTAALLVAAIPNLTSETFPDYAYKLAAPTVEQRAALLRSRAADELAQVGGDVAGPELPTVFAAAYGYRVAPRRGYPYPYTCPED